MRRSQLFISRSQSVCISTLTCCRVQVPISIKQRTAAEPDNSGQITTSLRWGFMTDSLKAYNTVAQHDSRNLSSDKSSCAKWQCSNEDHCVSYINILTTNLHLCKYALTTLCSDNINFGQRLRVHKAVFSMTFFNYSPGSEGQPGKWSVSDKMWIYWAISMPFTGVTVMLWFLWHYCFPRNAISSWY